MNIIKTSKSLLHISPITCHVIRAIKEKKNNVNLKPAFPLKSKQKEEEKKNDRISLSLHVI